MWIFAGCLLLAPFTMVAMMWWWAGCALPYGDFNPTPGGPGMRWVKYHAQLQQRVGEGSWLDWLNWRCGIFLRCITLLLGVITLLGCMMDTPVPAPIAYELAVLVAAPVSIWIMDALTWLIREFWKRLEPPADAEPQAKGEIGSSLPQPGQGRGALAVGVLLTVPLVLAFRDINQACWAVVVCCLVGYPVYCWGDWAGKRPRL